MNTSRRVFIRDGGGAKNLTDQSRSVTISRMAKKQKKDPYIICIEDLHDYWNRETIVLYCRDCQVETTSMFVDANPPNIEHNFAEHQNPNHKTYVGTSILRPYIFHLDCQKPLVLAKKTDNGYEPIPRAAFYANKFKEFRKLYKMTRPEPIPLPSYEKPTDDFDALMKIRALEGFAKQTSHEIAFKFGIYYGYVKKDIGHGKFVSWVENNTNRWSYRTVRRFMSYAEQCLIRGYLLDYRPSGEPKIDSMSFLGNPADTEVVDITEEKTPAIDAELDKPVQHVSEDDAIAAKKDFVWSVNWAVDKVSRTLYDTIRGHSLEERTAVLETVKRRLIALTTPSPVDPDAFDGDFETWVGAEPRPPVDGSPTTDQEVIEVFASLEDKND